METEERQLLEETMDQLERSLLDGPADVTSIALDWVRSTARKFPEVLTAVLKLLLRIADDARSGSHRAVVADEASALDHLIRTLLLCGKRPLVRAFLADLCLLLDPTKSRPVRRTSAFPNLVQHATQNHILSNETLPLPSTQPTRPENVEVLISQILIPNLNFADRQTLTSVASFFASCEFNSGHPAFLPFLRSHPELSPRTWNPLAVSLSDRLRKALLSLPHSNLSDLVEALALLPCPHPASTTLAELVSKDTLVIVNAVANAISDPRTSEQVHKMLAVVAGVAHNLLASTSRSNDLPTLCACRLFVPLLPSLPFPTVRVISPLLSEALRLESSSTAPSPPSKGLRDGLSSTPLASALETLLRDAPKSQDSTERLDLLARIAGVLRGAQIGGEHLFETMREELSGMEVVPRDEEVTPGRIESLLEAVGCVVARVKRPPIHRVAAILNALPLVNFGLKSEDLDRAHEVKEIGLELVEDLRLPDEVSEVQVLFEAGRNLLQASSGVAQTLGASLVVKILSFHASETSVEASEFAATFLLGSLEAPDCSADGSAMCSLLAALGNLNGSGRPETKWWSLVCEAAWRAVESAQNYSRYLHIWATAVSSFPLEDFPASTKAVTTLFSTLKSEEWSNQQRFVFLSAAAKIKSTPLAYGAGEDAVSSPETRNSVMTQFIEELRTSVLSKNTSERRNAIRCAGIIVQCPGMDSRFVAAALDCLINALRIDDESLARATSVTAYEELALVARRFRDEPRTASQALKEVVRQHFDVIVPLALMRILDDHESAADLAGLLDLELPDMWKEIKKVAVPALVRRDDLETLSKLADRCGLPLKEMVKSTAPEIVSGCLTARNSRQFVSRVEELLEQSIPELIWLNGNSISRILVRQLGQEPPDRNSAERALNTAAQYMYDLAEGDTTRQPTAGDFLSRHFLFVLDSLSQMILLRGQTGDRLRALKSLMAVLKLAKEHVHQYVPKTMAILQLAFHIKEPPVRAAVCETWGSFLDALGPERAGSHIASVVVILGPYLVEYGDILGPPLLRLVDECSNAKYLQNVVLPSLAGTSRHESVRAAFWKIERAIDECNYNVDKEIERLLDIASSHESRTVRSAALDSLYSGLRRKRELTGSLSERYPLLLKRLVSQLTRACGEDDRASRIIALRCFGELGAVDPSQHLLSTGSANIRNDGAMSSAGLYLQGPFWLGSKLLSDYVVVALKKGEKKPGGDALNHFGLAIQELLKSFHCTPATPQHSKNLSTLDSSNQPGDAENATGSVAHKLAARFWISLSEETQLAVMPYLKSNLYSSTSKVANFHAIHQPRAKASLWLTEFAARVIDHLSETSGMIRVLRACRNAARNDYRTAKFLLPSLIAETVTQDQIGKKSERTTFICSEMCSAIELGGESAQIAFTLLDQLATIKSFRSRCANGQDPLQVLVGWDYAMEKRGIPLQTLAVGARKVESFARAALYLEALYRESKNASVMKDLQEVYGTMGNVDGVSGVAAVHHVSDVYSLLMVAESNSRYEEAQVLYEELLRSNRSSPVKLRGYANCLRAASQWEGILCLANHHVRNLDHEAREELIARGIEAAWRLGQWDQIRTFEKLSRSGRGLDEHSEFHKSLGAMFASFSKHDKQGFDVATNRAISSLELPAVRNSAAGYSGVYQLVARMHSVADIEDAFRFANDDEGASPTAASLLVHMDKRVRQVSPTFQDREPILASRAVCLELLGNKTEAAKCYLQAAKLSRKTRNLRSAAIAIHRAESLGSTLAIVEKAKLLVAQGESERAMSMLKRKLITFEGKALDNTESQQVAKLHLLSGRWMERTRSSSSETILEHFRTAVELAPGTEKPLYALGRYFDILLRAAARSELERPGANLPEGARAIPMANETAKSELVSATSPEAYAPLVISNFGNALKNGSRYVFEALPRMLTLWFDYGAKEPRTTKEMRSAFEMLPKHLFVAVLPQMLSRLLHKDVGIKTALISMLVEITICHTDQALWYVVPVTKSKDKSRSSMANQIVATSSKLTRDNGVKKKLSAAKDLIKELITVCCMSPSQKNAKRLSASRDLARLHKLVAASSRVMVPNQKTLSVALPIGPTKRHMPDPFPEEPICFHALEEEVILMNSLMKPKKVTVKATDGRHYGFLCKREDSGDMRKDARLMEFVSVVNRALQENPKSRQRELNARTYAVLPLNEECGILEWVSDLSALRSIVTPLHRQAGCTTSNSDIKRALDSRQFSPLEFYRDWILPRLPPVLHRFFLNNFLDPTAWLEARTRYTRTVSVWSMVGYIVGLGDRHAENLSIETTTGACVHVDFACLFEKGLTLRVPEVVPFRLTPNMTDAMGVTGYEGPFRASCEVTVEVLRSNHDALMSVLESFLHDPLVEWPTKDTMSREKACATNDYAHRTLRSVEQKLLGVAGVGLPLSVKGQVDRLIIEATSQRNLSRMYIWWMPWL